MRTVFILAAVLFAATAHAGTIPTSYSLGDSRNISGATAVDAFVQLGSSGPLKWTLPIDVSDVGTTFTLTADNADDFGFDWSFAETFVAGIGHTNFTLQVGSLLNGTEDKTSRVFAGPATSQVSLIDLQLAVQSFNQDSVSVVGTLHVLTPEPTCVALLTCAVFSTPLRRRSLRRARRA